MKLNQIPALKASKSSKRVGRGIGSGKGKTAGRGTKGQKSRSGVSLLGNTGGNRPFWKSIPRRGFKNERFALKAYALNLKDINILVETKKIKETISLDSLKKEGLAPKRADTLRILGQGDLKSPLKIQAHHFSKTAEEKITKLGGECIKIACPVQGPKTGKTAREA